MGTKNKIWRDSNKGHIKKYQKNYATNNPNVKKDILKRWQNTNKDKLYDYSIQRSHKTHKIAKLEWERCKEYFNNKCAYCGLDISNHYIKYAGKIKLRNFHKEHVIHDGESDLSNFVPSCKYCDVSKHTQNMEEWFQQQDFFTFERLNKILIWINEDYAKL